MDAFNARGQIGRPSAAGNCINARRKKRVHTSKDTVLFMDHTWQTQ